MQKKTHDSFFMGPKIINSFFIKKLALGDVTQHSILRKGLISKKKYFFMYFYFLFVRVIKKKCDTHSFNGGFS